jgi:Fe-S cluster assembly protein SufD
MSDIVDFYHQQALAKPSTIAWLATLKKDASADFKQLGFPNRHNEEWKYTSVDGLVQQPFELVPDLVTVSFDPTEPRPLGSGIFVTCQNKPKGVIIQPLEQALIEHAEKIKPYLGQIVKHEHGFQALNTAMIATGVFIYLPAGVSLSEPLVISHWHDKAQQAIFLRHVIIAEEGSLATIVEDYQGENSYFVNTVTEVYTGKHAQLTHYKIQNDSKLAYHIGHLAVNQAAGSRFNSHQFSFGGKLMRSDLAINLNEPQASCFMNGIYAPSDDQHMDHHTCVTHAVPDCSSVQDYKGILNGKSRAVFNGKVIVAKHAQHTNAQQQNKNLLLSLNSEIDTKPQLEIFANDVTCTHGATVGQLDQEALFYLATRGIEQEEASQYLIQAFAVENFRAVENPKLAQDLNALLLQQIGGV